MTIPNPTFDHLYRPNPQVGYGQGGQRGWICPICNAGVSPSVSQHCGNQITGPVTVGTPIKAGKWCSLCRSSYYGDVHTCLNKTYGGGVIYTNVPTTTASTKKGRHDTGECVNGCDGVQSACSACP